MTIAHNNYLEALKAIILVIFENEPELLLNEIQNALDFEESGYDNDIDEKQ